MTDQDLIEYYSNLLILQYQTDKIKSHMNAILKPLVIFELIQSVKTGYDVETAIGIQLDSLGKIIGLGRNLTDGETTTPLGDIDYRKYLKFKIIKNFSNYSLRSIDTMLYNFFLNKVKCIDNFNMSAKYIIYNDLTLAKILKYENLFPKPMGVQLFIIAAPSSTKAFSFNKSGCGWGSIKGDFLELSDGSPLMLEDGTKLLLVTPDSNIPSVEGVGGQWSIQLS
jgi:hypothetical protein